MRILYIAGAVLAPGSHGGATHVMEVARELSKLGHELHIVCRRTKGESARLYIPIENGLPLKIYRLRLPQYFNFFSYPWLARLARTIQPDFIIERYYNFAGAGLLYAHRHRLPSILEINALMVDPPATRKYRLDHLLGRPLERWATQQCQWADRLVTPLHTTVPAAISRAKIAELPWGANVEQFDPSLIDVTEKIGLRQKLGLPDDAIVAVFAGSFRHWHGVELLVEAARLLIAQDEKIYFLLLGGGPGEAKLRETIGQAGLQKRIIMTGSLPNAQMPLYLSLADCGVAPFDTSKHLPLRAAGFFWSPLKIFEYMAMNLPTITPNLPPLSEIIRPRQEGLLFKEGDAVDLAGVLAELLKPEMAQARLAMGTSARARVVEHYSWAAHSRALNDLIKELCANK